MIGIPCYISSAHFLPEGFSEIINLENVSLIISKTSYDQYPFTY